MNARQLFNQALNDGVVLYLDNGKLKYQVASGGLSDELRGQLKLYKADIIEYLQQLENEEKARGWKLPELTRYEGNDKLELSFAQQRLWFIDKLEGGSPQYNMPGAFKLDGTLDRDAFYRAVDTILQRHQVLRTHFDESQEPVTQYVIDNYELPLTEVDLSDWPEDEKALEVQRLANHDAHTAFDLDNDLMLRVSLVELSEVEHMVLFNMHHIASDGWSKALLMSEFGEIYEAYRRGLPNPLPNLEIQYKDFAVWQRNWMQGEVLAQHLDFWRHYLDDIPAVHKLPLDKPRPAQQTFNGTVHNSVLNEKLTARIRAYCKEKDVTLFMFLHTAYVAMLSRYSGENDIVLGTPVAGRHRQELEDLIGFFVNTLVLRTKLEDNVNFQDLLAVCKTNILDVFSHQHIPFEMLVEELKPERSLSYSPVFQMLFVLQNYEKKDVGFSELKSRQVAQDNHTIKFDMELAAVEFEHNIGMTWIYNTALFEGQTIARLAANIEVLIESILYNDQQPLHSCPLICEAEQNNLLGYSRDNRVFVEAQLCAHQLIEQQAAQSPDAKAVTFANESLTYAELNAKANQLARYLVNNGVKPNQSVGLYLERSIEMVVGILAVLKAGAAYLPLDPDQPEERVSMMVEDANLEVMLTQPKFAKASIGEKLNVVCLDANNAWSNEDSTNLNISTKPSDLAYSIYTSGSTGVPKGVLVEHHAIVSRVKWMQSEYQLSADDVMLQKTPYGFDVSVVEFLWPLAFGAQLVLAQPGGHKDPEHLAQLMAEHKVSVVQFVPSMLRLFLASNEGQQFEHLRYTLAAGEAIDNELISAFSDNNTGGELVNLYGPTEACVYASHWPCNQHNDMPVVIGKPVGGTELHVLDSHNNIVPVGVVGELHIGGEGLARGYHNRDELTAQQFISVCLDGANPLRLYKTGDLARWLPNGNLEYLGRIDNQVKLRGFRIELGEIEAQLLKLDIVYEAVVTTVKTGTGDHLCGYVTTTSEGEAANDIKQALAETLPEYMVPTYIMALDEMPLNASGKLDRKKLPMPDAHLLIAEGQYVPPSNDMEETLCGLWQKVLKVEQVGVNDNFFTLGGHSLLIPSLAREIEAAFGVAISVRILFERSSVLEFASWLNIYINHSVVEDMDDENEFIEEIL